MSNIETKSEAKPVIHKMTAICLPIQSSSKSSSVKRSATDEEDEVSSSEQSTAGYIRDSCIRIAHKKESPAKDSSVSKPKRKYTRVLDRNSEEWAEWRARNNRSVKKCREKTRQRIESAMRMSEDLAKQNHELHSLLTEKKQELKVHKTLLESIGFPTDKIDELIEKTIDYQINNNSSDSNDESGAPKSMALPHHHYTQRTPQVIVKVAK